MPIIPVVGRRSPGIVTLLSVVYLLLIAGSVTMIYPFFIMLSGSVKGNADSNAMDPFPAFLRSRSMQFARFEEARYSTLAIESAAFEKTLLQFSDVTTPKGNQSADVKEYNAFLQKESASFPSHFYLIAEMYPDHRLLPRNYRKFRDEVRKECGSIEAYNRKYKAVITTWNDFPGGYDAPFVKEFSYDNSDPITMRYLEFKRSQPIEDKVFVNIDGYFQVTQETFPEIKSGQLTALPILAERSPTGKEKLIWERFVKHNLNCLFVKLDSAGLSAFRQFLSARFPQGIQQMNRINDTSYASFTDVNASEKELQNGALFTLYTDFITNNCPVEHLIVDTPSTRYRAYRHSATASIPFVAADYQLFQQTKKPFMHEMLTRNYVSVLQYIITYGRAIFNTIVFIGLSVLAALLVNPLAAYALSRFKPKSTYMILMFFLLSTAFPGAVTMIPNFLLLKNLHLLNTMWALVLPGVANGYSIFILKGFFDSIPSEIYEAATIDGASEWTMFWKFTMSLSKPILALITLNAFTAAYTAFMFALIICPDERMWTLMVWLYQMQQSASQPVIYAALVLTAIPTLLVFLLAQNVIMRGIVVPVEK